MIILDLFCGAGGASMGLHQAFPEARIVGVDNRPMPHYPFEFYQADALEFLAEHWKKYDFIWASPPCQFYSVASVVPKKRGIEYADLVAPTRTMLQGTGKPWIIENVPGAPLIDPIFLCGQMFGLRILRHRLFETSFPVAQPYHRKHLGLKRGKDADYISCVDGAHKPYSPGEDKPAWQQAMGIDWMTKKEMSQAVPPAYAAYLGRKWALKLAPGQSP